MADTKPHSQPQVNPQLNNDAFIEGDGISYRGIVIFMVILAVTTFICQGIVVGMFKYMDAKAVETSPSRAAMAGPAGAMPPAPNLLTDEPANLRSFRTTEEEALHTYGWADKNAGVVRVPIHRAKELLLERGLPYAGAAGAAGAPVSEIKK